MNTHKRLGEGLFWSNKVSVFVDGVDNDDLLVRVSSHRFW